MAVLTRCDTSKSSYEGVDLGWRSRMTESQVRALFEYMTVEISRLQKVVIAWAVIGLSIAEYVRRVQVSSKWEMRVGLLEMLLAAVTGLALGISILKRPPA